MRDYELGHVKEGVGAGGISLLAFLDGFKNEEIVSLCQLNLEMMKSLGQISLEKDCWMFSKFATRREFLNCGKLSLLFFLNSCSNLPIKVKIALQNSFYPESFKDTITKDWKQ